MGINNSLDALHPDLRRVYEATLPKWKVAHPKGPFVALNETSRSEAVQTAYYARGRESVAVIQHLYRLAGLYAIGFTEASSKPISNAKYGQSAHNFPKGRAFDIRPTDAKGTYLTGAAFDKACKDFWLLFKAEADTLGVAVTWGGTWNDGPHIELTRWRTLKD